MQKLVSDRQRVASEINLAIQKMLPPMVCAVSVGWGGEDISSLHPEEYGFTLSMSPGRARIFSAGRRQARAALEQLGGKDMPILRDADGAPIWPDGFTGSISHAGEVAASVVSSDSGLLGIGIDIEYMDAPFPEGVDELAFEPSEITFAECSGSSGYYQLFSAKEAAFKAIYHATGLSLGWDEFRIEPDLQKGRFSAIIKHPHICRDHVIHGRISTTINFSMAVCAVLS